MKKIITAITVLMMVCTIGCIAIACDDGEYNVNEADGIPSVLLDTEVAPDASVASSVNTPILPFINDASLTDAEKIQKIMNAAEINESYASRFTYFNYTTGTTSIDGKSGTLIYQRLRKQTSNSKDDITLKLPINHNFGSSEVAFVRSAVIRYNPPGNTYYRMEADGEDIKYDSETGLLSVDNSAWKKKIGSFGTEGTITPGDVEDMKKTCTNWSCKNIVKADTAKIEKKTTEDGAVYYELTFEIDSAVANSDAATIDRLQQDNSGKNMSVNYIRMKVQMWECGLLKAYSTEESWNGKIGAVILWYEGSAESKANVVYSYSERDNDMSNTESIKNGLL